MFGRRSRRKPAVAGAPGINPAELRFNTPTLCELIPPDSPAAPSERAFELHEDDWRDVEFVADSQQVHVDFNFAEIRQIYEGAGGIDGFSRVHMRTEPSAPLGSTVISVNDLVDLLTTATRFEGVHLTNHPGVAADTYALVLPSGLTVYGVGAADKVQQVALDPWSVRGSFEGDVLALLRLMTAFSQSVVVWRQCRQIHEREALAAWLGSVAAGNAPGTSGD